jgi:thiol-disulfide isomerase/thioredoxin
MKRLLIAPVVLLFFASCSGSGQEFSGETPDFSLPAVDGSMFRMADHAGQVILIDFWATWCPPCQEMVPVLKKLHEDFSDKGLFILGISLDQEGLKVLSPFVHQNRIPYSVVMADDQTVRAFGGITTIPTLFIVDREGKLVKKMLGYHTYDDLEDVVKKYL